MRQMCAPLALVISVLLFQLPISAQPGQERSVPRVIKITGVFRPADGQPPAATEIVTLAIYADAEGGAPLWQETQTVALDDRGRYTLLLGASHPEGIPAVVFASGAQWLATRFERRGEVDGARVRLTSVPYALRAADADTLGGRPASDYVVAPNTGSDSRAAGTTSGTHSADASSPNAVLGGTPNVLAKYVNAADVGDSAVYESGGMVGIGTTTPADFLHVKYTNITGAFTGFAVQNMGNTATSYSGMLFYDQNNALGQFQGFNNVTHEYRINNIARNGASQFNGSINFMVGSTSRFFVASNGNIGIGTNAPSTNFEVSNALTGSAVADVNLTSFGSNSFGSLIAGRKARGTAVAPSPVLSGDSLSIFGARGYGATGFSSVASGFTITAAENWTDTAQGTLINFTTTPTGTNVPISRMTLTSSGNLGIGASFPSGNLEVSNSSSGSPFTQVTATTYAATGQGSLFVGRKARGTSTVPAAVQTGDVLAGVLGRGYGATNFFGTGSGGVFVRAAENWTDTAQGTSVNVTTSANGTAVPLTRLTVNHDGFVGVGTNSPTGMLDIARNGTTNVIGTSYGGQGSGFKGRAAGGTFAAPTATQVGDELAEFTAAGYGTTGFNETAGWAAFAAENWTDAAQGTALGIYSTPIGSNVAQLYLGILANGNIGIGTPTDVDGFPTATDRLQVFGDVRVGTAGTNGCLKDFSGTGIVGTCSSDRRLKKDITPFEPILNQLTSLQPVHYFWRTSEFPERHFGNRRADGLIAQDVEQVLPALVETDSDGYKAVNYSKLPLLTIQAVKELKAENDTLTQRVTGLTTANEALAQRIAELERLVADMLAATGRR